MAIRLATPKDADSILKIYAQYIHTPITFEYILPTEDQFTQRIQAIYQEYPYLVYEEVGQIIGYAYAHRYMEREAYQWDAEPSIYLDQNVVAKGIGRKLFHVLLNFLKEQGIKTVYSRVTVPNEKSEKLHQSFGFAKVATFYNTGYKCDQWQDMAVFEKQINPYDASPSPIIPIKNLSEQVILSILNNM